MKGQMKISILLFEFEFWLLMRLSRFYVSLTILCSVTCLLMSFIYFCVETFYCLFILLHNIIINAACLICITNIFHYFLAFSCIFFLVQMCHFLIVKVTCFFNVENLWKYLKHKVKTKQTNPSPLWIASSGGKKNKNSEK